MECGSQVNKVAADIRGREIFLCNFNPFASFCLKISHKCGKRYRERLRRPAVGGTELHVKGFAM